MANFEAHTQQEHQLALGQYLPNDRLFAAKNYSDTNLFKLLTGIAGEFKRVDEIFQSVWDGTNILTTQDIQYIRLWEGALGIPDESFLQTESLSLDDRRNQVLIKLRSLGVLTEQDFKNLATLLGISINIVHGIDVLYPPYTAPFIPMANAKFARFTMIIQGPNLDISSYPPYSVPFIPVSVKSQLTTLFDIVKPAMVTIIYQNS
tara:strand:+ start:64 stop:678 length:615 start_codon:yes stop_codon:yes gene_type:complete